MEDRVNGGGSVCEHLLCAQPEKSKPGTSWLITHKNDGGWKYKVGTGWQLGDSGWEQVAHSQTSGTDMGQLSLLAEL